MLRPFLKTWYVLINNIVLIFLFNLCSFSSSEVEKRSSNIEQVLGKFKAYWLL